VDISRKRFADASAAHVVLSRDDAFPDSLAGASLTAAGPLLFTQTASVPIATWNELRRVLPAGGRVYLLGGESAISAAVAQRLTGEGFAVERLWGQSRVETAIAIAGKVRALHPGERRVGVARAFGVDGNESAGWADSVTGGGWAASAGVPILVTPTEGVHPAVRAWLDADGPSQTVLFGGTAALSPAVEAAVPNPRRVSGGERAATAAAIATELWGASSTGARRFTIISGFRADGWMFGLAAAGPAADATAPLLMVTDDVIPQATAGLVSACGAPQVDLLLIGGTDVISQALADELDQLDGGAC
jgi:putative cell wall-binding protein